MSETGDEPNDLEDPLTDHHLHEVAEMIDQAQADTPSSDSPSSDIPAGDPRDP